MVSLSVMLPVPSLTLNLAMRRLRKKCSPSLGHLTKFDQYLYGRDKITVEFDHEPLKSVFKKEIHKSPKRLQQMRLALQKYNLEVQYKKGTLMHIADALSLMGPRPSFVRFVHSRW